MAFSCPSLTRPSYTRAAQQSRRKQSLSRLLLLSATLTCLIASQTIANAAPTDIPAKIEAEDYTNYLDLSTGNQGGAYRNDNVDIQATMDTGGGFNVGWIEAQEWLEYEVQVPETGSYTVDLRVASAPGGGQYQIQLDGANVSDARTVGATGGWQSFTTQTVELGTLSKGIHNVRLQVTAGNFNLNWLEFKAFNTIRIDVPGRIEAESYQRYYDTTNGNSGGGLRSDDVDVSVSNDVGGGHKVNNTANGEWLEYDINVTQAGLYDAEMRVKSANNSSAVSLEVNGIVVAQDVDVPNSDWTSNTASIGQLAAGDNTLRLIMSGSSIEVNWLDLQRSQITATDQCNFTSECKKIYGNGATDCKDSRSNQSICMCGSSPCSGDQDPTPPTPPTPPAPSTDQCDTTAQCKASFGNSATDCKNSRSEQSICMCGSSPCSGNPNPPVPPTPPNPGTGKLGKFDKAKDLFLAFFDNKPDADDIHSQAGVATLLQDKRFDGVNFYSVLGAYGKQNAAFLNSNSVMNQCFGASNWTNAHPKDGPNWDASLDRVFTRAQSTLNAGGDIWIMEAGQSDFTADLVRKLKASNSNINTKNRIHVVQHSKWNEDQTTPADFNYTKANTDYNKIADGNSGNNGSPQFNTRNGSQWNRAISIPGVGACWAEARRVANAENFSGNGHYENPSIEAGGFDFSDVVEGTWIFGFNSLRNINNFFDEFPQQ